MYFPSTLLDRDRYITTDTVELQDEFVKLKDFFLSITTMLEIYFLISPVRKLHAFTPGP